MRTLTALLLIATGLPAQKRPITHEDVWLMKRAGAPAVSPDGKWAVTAVTEPSYDAAKSVSDLWIAPLDGSSPPRRLTNTLAPESGAVFSPDSRRLAFATKREGDDVPQIYVLPLDGGEAMRVTNLSTGASDPQWRPDGKAILFESRVYPGSANDADNRRIAAERKARKYNLRVFDSFPIRYWDHWLDDLRPHVFVQDLEEGAPARDLLAGTKLAAQPGFEGEFDDSGSSLGARWSPDGNSIVFIATTDLNRSVTAPVSTELYRIPSQGGEPVALNCGAGELFAPGVPSRRQGPVCHARTQRGCGALQPRPPGEDRLAAARTAATAHGRLGPFRGFHRLYSRQPHHLCDRGGPGPRPRLPTAGGWRRGAAGLLHERGQLLRPGDSGQGRGAGAGGALAIDGASGRRGAGGCCKRREPAS